MLHYYSSTIRHSFKNGNRVGSKNVVSIKDDKGFKQVDVLNSEGKVMKTVKKNLTKEEIETIMGGKFLPGLWNNCTRKNAITHKNKNNMKNIIRNKTVKNTNVPILNTLFPTLSSLLK